MYRLIRGIVIFAALAPLGAAAALPDVNPHKSAAHRHKPVLAPTAPAEPESMVVLPAPLTPLTPQEMPAQPPAVSYLNGILTVDSQNSTVTDILIAIRRITGAEFEPMPKITERAAVHVSGSAAEVVSSLLRGSDFGYILIASPDDPNILQRVFLTPTEAAIARNKSAAAARPVPAQLPPQLQPEPAAETESSAPLTEPQTVAAREPEEAPAVTQPAIVLPDPVQIAERVNQQNRDPNATPVNPAGQYMQELYKLRLQQNSPSNTAAGAAPAAAPQ